MAEKNVSKDAKAPPQDNRKDKPVARGRPQSAPTKAIVAASGREVKGVVRLAGKDLNGGLPLRRAITMVRGIGTSLGNIIGKISYKQLNFNDKTLVGELTEEEIEKLEHILRNPGQYGVPTWMLNRQKDLFTGNNIHLIGPDLTFAIRQDIDHEKDSTTYRGYRHAYGQKVRGQRTRSTGRTGMTVGVLRKAVLAKAGAAATAQTGAAAQAAGAAPAAGKAPSAAAASKAPAKKEEAKK